MIRMDSDHCQIVKDAIIGKKTVNEETLASLAILGERLKRLQEMDKAFRSVAFSSAVKKLTEQNSAVGVC